MKIKTLISSCLVSMVILFLVHQFGEAQPLANAPASNIGIVHIDKALQNCQATVRFKERMETERSEMLSEEGSLTRKIEGQKEGLQALVPNSPAWVAQYKDVQQKESALKVLRDLNPQIIEMKSHQWMEKLFPEILRITRELAVKKNLVLVLSVEEPTFPMQRPDMLTAAVQTHKVLYSGGCVDLTTEVIAELDKTDSLFIN